MKEVKLSDTQANLLANAIQTKQAVENELKVVTKRQEEILALVCDAHKIVGLKAASMAEGNILKYEVEEEETVQELKVEENE